MVLIKLTFIPSDGSLAKDYQLENFDIAGVSGKDIRQLLADKVNVPTRTSHLVLI